MGCPIPVIPTHPTRTTNHPTHSRRTFSGAKFAHNRQKTPHSDLGVTAIYTNAPASFWV